MSELYMIVLQGKEELGNDPEAIKLWAELSGVDIDAIDENTPFDIDMADRLLRTLPEVIEKMKERAMKDVESLEERLKRVLESRQEKEEAEDLLQKLDRELEETPIIPEVTEKETPQPTQEIEIPSGPLFAEEVQKEEPQEVQEVAPVEEAPIPVEKTPRVEEVSEPVVSEAETEVKAQYDIVEQPVEVSIPELVRLFRIEEGKVYVLKGNWPDEYDPILGTLASGLVNRFSFLLKNGHTLYGERVGSLYVMGEFEERNLGIVGLLFRKVLKTLSL